MGLHPLPRSTHEHVLRTVHWRAQAGMPGPVHRAGGPPPGLPYHGVCSSPRPQTAAPVAGSADACGSQRRREKRPSSAREVKCEEQLGGLGTTTAAQREATEFLHPPRK